MKRWLGAAVMAIAVLGGLGPAEAFSGFKGRFQGRCPAVTPDAPICGVTVELPGARNGADVRVDGREFTCRGSAWWPVDGGVSCCRETAVTFCGETRRLPIAEAGRTVNLTGGSDREEMYVCAGGEWVRDPAEVWGLCESFSDLGLPEPEAWGD